MSEGTGSGIRKWVFWWWEDGGKSQEVVRDSREKEDASPYLVHRIARQDGATKVPVIQDTLLERDERATRTLRPQLAENHGFGDGVVGDAGGGAVGIVRREALACRPGEGLREAEKHKEEDLVGLREDEERVALVVDASHGATAHLWCGRAHADEARPAGRDSYRGRLVH